MLVLAHLAGAAMGEEMGGPSPHPAAALAPVPVQPGLRLLQVGGRQIWALPKGSEGSEAELWNELLAEILCAPESRFTLCCGYFCV